MKTPREILLERHRAVEPKLDTVRRALVGELNNKEIKEQRGANGFTKWYLRFLSQLWRELVLPSRRIWTGLAAVWMVLFVINISQRDNVSSVTGQPVRSAPVMMSWQTQQRLMNEVLADRMAPPDVDRPRNDAPKPRTETNGVKAA